MSSSVSAPSRFCIRAVIRSGRVVAQVIQRSVEVVRYRELAAGAAESATCPLPDQRDDLGHGFALTGENHFLAGAGGLVHQIGELGTGLAQVHSVFGHWILLGWGCVVHLVS